MFESVADSGIRARESEVNPGRAGAVKWGRSVQVRSGAGLRDAGLLYLRGGGGPGGTVRRGSERHCATRPACFPPALRLVLAPRRFPAPVASRDLSPLTPGAVDRAAFGFLLGNSEWYS